MAKQTNAKIGFENELWAAADAMRGSILTDHFDKGKIANILEYGRHGQTPKPFLKPAKSQSRKACIETMKEKFESEVAGI
ncbi:hypothetical protein PJ261_03135 [Streptococcus dysgalactiae]|uniref:hypothetical protein n=1 Tax=Streptococcus dysgalactiae TaxID=1334 RepID=UPI0035D01154